MKLPVLNMPFVLLLLLSAPLAAKATPAYDAFIIKADQFFNTYVRDGRVNYDEIKTHDASLYQLIGEIKQADVSGFTKQEKKAFYINAYNLLVIYQIVNNLDVIKTTYDFAGFFDKFRFSVGGEMMTLNKLEIKYLVLPYNDPRIHFALACGALGCPKLQSTAFRPEKLDQQLEAVTRSTLNDPHFIRVKGNEVQLSQLFKWYEKDFLVAAPSVIDFINGYRNKPLKKGTAIGYYKYDWNLNKVNNPSLTN